MTFLALCGWIFGLSPAGLSPTQAYAQAKLEPAAQLACAVEWSDVKPAPQALCEAVGRAVGRRVRRVDNARAVKQGESVQVMNEDLHWVVVWLRDGKVRAWTRVSKALASADPAATIARVATGLSREPAADGASCVRVDVNGGHTMRSMDLVYPWAELRRCKRRKADVSDPWGP